MRLAAPAARYGGRERPWGAACRCGAGGVPGGAVGASARADGRGDEGRDGCGRPLAARVRDGQADGGNCGPRRVSRGWPSGSLCGHGMQGGDGPLVAGDAGARVGVGR